MATSLDEVKAKLDQLEKVEVEYRGLCKQYGELGASLEKGREALGKLKEQYDRIVGPYALQLTEAEEIYGRIKTLADTLGERHPDYYVTAFGYSGNVGEYNTGLAIHESVAPAVIGKQLWPLVVETLKRKREGR